MLDRILDQLEHVQLQRLKVLVHLVQDLGGEAVDHLLVGHLELLRQRPHRRQQLLVLFVHRLELGHVGMHLLGVCERGKGRLNV